MGRTIVLLAIEEGHVVLLDCCDESGVLAVLDRPECALDCARSSERTGERAETKQTHARVLRERRARQYGDRSYLRRVHNLRTVGAQTVLLHESRTVSSPVDLAERGAIAARGSLIYESQGRVSLEVRRGVGGRTVGELGGHVGGNRLGGGNDCARTKADVSQQSPELLPGAYATQS